MPPSTPWMNSNSGATTPRPPSSTSTRPTPPRVSSCPVRTCPGRNSRCGSCRTSRQVHLLNQPVSSSTTATATPANAKACRSAATARRNRGPRVTRTGTLAGLAHPHACLLRAGQGSEDRLWRAPYPCAAGGDTPGSVGVFARCGCRVLFGTGVGFHRVIGHDGPHIGDA